MRVSDIVLISLLIFLSQCTSSPLNRKQVTLYSEGEMASQGDSVYRAIKESTPMSAKTAKREFIWEITTFKDPQINAFALPGGKIGVYEGLLGVADNQHQLAAVIAHEIGHVLAQHGNERASQAAIRNLGVIAAQALGVSESTVKAIDTSAQIGLLLPFSRIQESEADQIGLQLMAETGFDPLESVVLWQKMAENNSRRAPEILSTHPSPRSRIETLQTLMSSAEQTWVDSRKSGKNPDCIFVN